MVELFNEDYGRVLKAVSAGTDIGGPTAPTEGYYEGNLYINTLTGDIWQADEYGWHKAGNLNTIYHISIEESTEDDGNNIVWIETTDGIRHRLVVKNGKTGQQGERGLKGDTGSPAGFAAPTATINGSTGTPEVIISSSGPDTAKQFNFEFRNIKGEKGAKGDPGSAGKGILSITGKKTGKVTTFTANFTDGTSQVIGTVTDGSDGTGQGDMKYETYDPTQSGVVNYARGISNGSESIDDAYTYITGKADKGTTLAEYEIEDAYTKSETNEVISDAITELNYSVKGGVGKVITQIQQANGVISAEEADFDVADIKSKTSAIPSTDYLTDSKTYHTNELFIYNNKAYKVKNADNGILGSAIKSSLSTYADETTLGSEFGELNNKLDDTNNNLANVGKTELLIDESITGTTTLWSSKSFRGYKSFVIVCNECFNAQVPYDLIGTTFSGGCPVYNSSSWWVVIRYTLLTGNGISISRLEKSGYTNVNIKVYGIK